MSEIKQCAFCKQEKIIAARGWCRACYSRWQKTGSVEYKRSAEKKPCIVDGCDKFSVSHGYCDMHRKRLASHGSLESTRPNDWGSREKHPLYGVWGNLRRFRTEQACKEWRDDFWKFVEDVKERPSPNHYLRPIDSEALMDKDNFHWIERAASKTQEEKDYLKEWVRLDRKNNPEKYKDKDLQRTYGISLEEFNSMKDAQNNKCAICGNSEHVINNKTGEPRELAVDHCHDKGHVRGLLCTNCNKGLGHFKDDIALLEKAIVYLQTR